VGGPQSRSPRHNSDPSLPPLRRVPKGTPLVNVRTCQARHPPMVGLGGLSHFHPAALTTLPPEGPRVSRGHRTRAVSRVWLTGAALVFAGFGPQEVPPPDARCIVLIPLSMDGSLQEQSVAPLKGAPQRRASGAAGS
jgi:hypothetical protein